jgi:hypothetical protein
MRSEIEIPFHQFRERRGCGRGATAYSEGSKMGWLAAIDGLKCATSPHVHLFPVETCK